MGKKKLIMTELGSFAANDGTGEHCKTRIREYLRRLADSKVFIGYLVWQVGCPFSLGDQWSNRPSNLDWYELERYGGHDDTASRCSENGEDCRDTKCCKTPGAKCYEKNH